MHFLVIFGVLYLLPHWWFFVQGFIGLILFELAYARYNRVRAVVEERDSNFEEFRRIDLKDWSRLAFWPGAFLLLTTRFLLFLISATLLITFDTIIFIGQSY